MPGWLTCFLTLGVMYTLGIGISPQERARRKKAARDARPAKPSEVKLFAAVALLAICIVMCVTG